jgi:hypothetical protein
MEPYVPLLPEDSLVTYRCGPGQGGHGGTTRLPQLRSRQTSGAGLQGRCARPRARILWGRVSSGAGAASAQLAAAGPLKRHWACALPTRSTRTVTPPSLPARPPGTARSDVIPGLRRFSAAGLLSTTTKTVISSLASPMLSPTYSVMLRRLQLALPMRVHDLLMGLDARHGMATG